MGVIEAGQRIRAARDAAGLSYGDVHGETGLAKSHLQRLERGQVDEPSPHVLWRLARGVPALSYEGLMRDCGYLRRDPV